MNRSRGVVILTMENQSPRLGYRGRSPDIPTPKRSTMLQRFTIAAILLGLFVVAEPIFAQESSWQPTKPPPFNLTSPAVGKIYGDDTGSPVLGLIVFTSFREETQVKEVRDPKTGEARILQYQVSKPITNEKGEWVFQRKRVELPLDSAKIWSSGGKLLDPVAARKALTTPKRCFLMNNRNVKSIEAPIE